MVVRGRGWADERLLWENRRVPVSGVLVVLRESDFKMLQVCHTPCKARSIAAFAVIRLLRKGQLKL